MYDVNEKMKEIKTYKLEKMSLESIIKNGGATLMDGHRLEAEEGYIVALEGSEMQFKVNELKYHPEVMTILSKGLKGAWVNDGVLYIDSKLVFLKDYEAALLLAHKENQLGFWSWRAMETINTAEAFEKFKEDVKDLSQVEKLELLEKFLV